MIPFGQSGMVLNINKGKFWGFLAKVSFIIFIGFFLLFLGCRMAGDVWFIDFIIWECNSFRVCFNLLFDYISLIFFGTILIIFGRVVIYCLWYMDNEIYYSRFMAIIYLFVSSMMFIIFFPNLICLLLGWDGLGLTSFLLVAYYQNKRSLSGRILTAITNRIGDAIILCRICFWRISDCSWVLYEYRFEKENLFFVFALICGAITKSAQLPFCSWLPAAIAAPTPVSSLVHSSTLVTAGVYLLIRCYSCLIIRARAMLILKIFSLFTLVLAGSSAIFCFDIKKVIALSTLSQLSVIAFSLSCGLISVSFFHLVTHALFKALLFLSAGAVIHRIRGCQDMRRLGSLWRKLPLRIARMMVANFSLCGLPFMSGFFSKDLILDLVFNRKAEFWCFSFFVVGLSITRFYRRRIMWMTCYGLNKISIGSVRTKEPVTLIMPYCCLFLGAVFIGYKIGALNEVLFFFRNSSLSEIICLSLLFLLGWPYLCGFNVVSFLSFSKAKYVCSFLFRMWFLDNVTHLVKLCFFYFSYFLLKRCDKGVLEVAGPRGVYNLTKKISSTHEKYQANFFLRSIFFYFVLFTFSCIAFINY